MFAPVARDDAAVNPALPALVRGLGAAATGALGGARPKKPAEGASNRWSEKVRISTDCQQVTDPPPPKNNKK